MVGCAVPGTHTVEIQPFPLHPEKLFNSKKAGSWIIEGCAFCSDLNNGKPNSTHVSVVFRPQSHGSRKNFTFPTSDTSIICLSFIPPFPPFASTGIAVDKNGLMYFVDGTTIRRVDQSGIISTLLGSNDLTSARPLTCDISMDIKQVTVRLPVRSPSSLFCPQVCSHRAHITAPPCGSLPARLWVTQSGVLHNVSFFRILRSQI